MDKESIFNKDIIEDVFENLPNYVFCKDRNFIYRLCNDQFIKYAGLQSYDDVVGKTDFEMPWGETTADLYRQEDLEVIETGNPILSKEVEMEIPHLGSRILLVSKKALRDKDDNVVGILGIYIDITERKKQEEMLKQTQEQAKQASKAKSEFIANMSHDFRTPITGMLGMVQDMINTADRAEVSLNDKKTSQEDIQALKNMIKTVQRDGQFLMGATDELLQLCNEVLEVVSLGSGKFDNNVESFSLYELIIHNIELLQPVAHHKNVQLSYDIEQQIPRYLRGCRIYLDRILLNLISNALKFTKEGSVTVSVTALNGNDADRLVGDGITIQISVEDTGIGIPKDKFDIIFEHFSRLTPAYEGLYKGAGLGLYTVKRYVEAMQGAIDVESEMGQGACFTVTLPFTISDHVDRTKQSVRLPKAVKFAADKTLLEVQESVSAKEKEASILIVEDQSLAAFAVTLALKPFNCHIERAENGAKAVKMAQKGDYDLIFMDIGLPDFSGIEVTKKIRAFTDPKKSQVPIVALTGHANNPEMRQEAINAGMQEVLSKPAQPLALESVLQNYVFTFAAQKPLDRNASTTAEQVLGSRVVIDWDACVRMCVGDPAFARKMLGMLAADLKNTKAVLAQAYTNCDTKTLRAELHRVRGGVRYLKVPQLECALEAFHQAVKADPQDRKALESTYAALQEAMNVFWTAWESSEF